MSGVTAASISTQSRRRTAAALAAAAVGAAALLICLQSVAVAAPGSPGGSARAAAPVTTTAGKLTLTVDPAGGLTPAGATLKVTGRGFSTVTGIYVAICHADGKAPASLNDCVGGAIPDANTTNSWAHISNKAPAGGTVVPWGAAGSFTVDLVLPPSHSTSDALDCAKVPCAVYTTSDQGKSTTENLSVPLVYAAPVTTRSSPAVTTSTTPSSTASTASTPASSSPASSSPASSTPASSSPDFSTSAAVVPTTVQAESVRSASIVAGGPQEVLFAGFAKNEPVTVTLYSAPRSLPAARADQAGVVKLDFTVPADLEPGTHLLRVVGQDSKVTGVASFVVTAPVASSAVALPSTPRTTSVASSAPESSAVPVPATLASASPTAASTTAASSAIAPVVPPASSGRAVWPWYALGALLAILAGVVAYLLNRRFRLAVERRDNDAMLADAAAAEHERNLDAIARANADAPTSYPGGARFGIGPQPPTGGYAGYHPGEHGLLSGRDDPDSPGLLAGTGYRALPPVEPPTTVLPAEATTSLPGDATTSLSGELTTSGRGTPQSPDDEATAGGPPTGTWRPDFGTDPGNGPETRDEGRPAESSGGDPDDPASGGRHSRPS